VKPQLIEAKQCMKCFESRLDWVKLKIENNDKPIRQSSDKDQDNPNKLTVVVKEELVGLTSQLQLQVKETPTALDIQTNSSHMKISSLIRFTITNNYDHIDDISSELSFKALLLCDGLIVAYSPIQLVSSGQTCHILI
jgi:hypothetical protein